jgi:hypothetical protein
MMRVRPDVTGSLQVEGATFIVLDHEAVWDDDDPLVAANPDVFEKVPAKKKAGT